MQQKAQRATTVHLKFTGYNGLLKVCTVLSSKLWQVFHLVENRIVPFQDMKYVHFNGQNLTVETDQQIMVRLLTTR